MGLDSSTFLTRSCCLAGWIPLDRWYIEGWLRCGGCLSSSLPGGEGSNGEGLLKLKTRDWRPEGRVRTSMGLIFQDIEINVEKSTGFRFPVLRLEYISVSPRLKAVEKKTWNMSTKFPFPSVRFAYV